MRQIIWVLAACVISSPLYAQRIVENAINWSADDILQALPDTIPNVSYPFVHGRWEGESGMTVDFNEDGSALWVTADSTEGFSWWYLFAWEEESSFVWVCFLWPDYVTEEQRGVETALGRVTYPNESDNGFCFLAEIGGRPTQTPDGNSMMEMTLAFGEELKYKNTVPMPLPAGTGPDVSAAVTSASVPQGYLSLPLIRVLRHGEWNAIGLNTGEELRILFSPEETGVIMHAQVTVTRFFGAGPSTTMNFEGLFMADPTQGIAKIVSETHGMPGAKVICGQLSSVGYICMVVDGDFDGYIPGDNGSKLYNLILRIVIDTNKLEPAFVGVMRNPIPLKIAADGTVIW